ncbi:MAG: DPP IV N-terminal domain-containing protein [Gemmatimonadota bacterium]
MFALLLLPAFAAAQGPTPDDYARAAAVQRSLPALITNLVDGVTAIEDTHRFTYRRSVSGGHEFILIDGDTRAKRAAFDQARLATALGAVTGDTYDALTLPMNAVEFVDAERAIEFTASSMRYRCDVVAYTCVEGEPVPPGRPGTGLPDLSAPRPEPSREPKPSPDGRWEAFIQNFNVAIRPRPEDGAARGAATGGRGGPRAASTTTLLSLDGAPGNFYELSSVTWSPDSRKIVAYRVRPGLHREIQYIESSPTEQLQPRYWTREYPKPGDPVDIEQPVLFDIATKRQIEVDNTLFPNPYTTSSPVWREDSRSFTFDYNQRGHTEFRVIDVDAATGAPRALIDEDPRTFFNYRSATAVLAAAGKQFRHDVADGAEIIWMSERDNWTHLYLYDGATGRVKNQITRGDWVVREVVHVDEDSRQIWFVAGGMYADQDPYFAHYYRINFDGTGLTTFTSTPADHSVVFSTDMQYYIDTYSTVQTPPTVELRKTGDPAVLATLETADISKVLAAGWKPPEIFVSKARDGETDIWGIVVRPTNYDPSRKYPVIEFIYAGPQGSFVPKAFTGGGPGAGNMWSMQALAEMGFIVSQVDGMGTANRSKAFHDVAWKNLGDAGFPDRILWHKAIAAKDPSYDISRVGIYGGSAGGQNSTGALLFHPEFYKVAVSSNGCHDNRMDKISWNEQWMSWPIGPHYGASSNVDNAHRLEGHLLMMVGELDTNVDPTSTLQVMDALIKAGKHADLFFVPGAGHGVGGDVAGRMRVDFFVRHLQGLNTPNWNALNVTAASGPSSGG